MMPLTALAAAVLFFDLKAIKGEPVLASGPGGVPTEPSGAAAPATTAPGTAAGPGGGGSPAARPPGRPPAPERPAAGPAGRAGAGLAALAPEPPSPASPEQPSPPARAAVTSPPETPPPGATPPGADYARATDNRCASAMKRAASSRPSSFWAPMRFSVSARIASGSSPRRDGILVVRETH